MITVILSVFNEMNNAYFPQLLAQFEGDNFFQLICIDGGSTDGTLDALKNKSLSVFVLPDSTRAARLNLGIQKATSNAILLQHPRSLITQEGLTFLKSHYRALKWAAFTHQFDTPHWFLKWVSWYSNEVRVKRKKLVYLDHCIFMNKAFLQIAPIPDLAVFEDTALSVALQKQCRPLLLPAIVLTSAVRFLDRGIYKHFLLNQWIKCLYALKVDSQRINYLYERRVNLNQKN